MGSPKAGQSRVPTEAGMKNKDVVKALEAAFTGYERNNNAALLDLLSDDFTFEMSEIPALRGDLHRPRRIPRILEGGRKRLDLFPLRCARDHRCGRHCGRTGKDRRALDPWHPDAERTSFPVQGQGWQADACSTLCRYRTRSRRDRRAAATSLSEARPHLNWSGPAIDLAAPSFDPGGHRLLFTCLVQAFSEHYGQVKTCTEY